MFILFVNRYFAAAEYTGQEERQYEQNMFHQETNVIIFSEKRFEPFVNIGTSFFILRMPHVLESCTYRRITCRQRQFPTYFSPPFMQMTTRFMTKQNSDRTNYS